jgi:hypothetical protein
MECSICQEDYNENENKPYLINPCGHCMCLKCLYRLTSPLCPHCRGKIESRTINRGILDCINTIKNLQHLTIASSTIPSAASIGPSTHVDPNVEKNQKEKLLAEIKQLNSRLASTFKLKKTESKLLIKSNER